MKKRYKGIQIRGESIPLCFRCHKIESAVVVYQEFICPFCFLADDNKYIQYCSVCSSLPATLKLVWLCGLHISSRGLEGY